MEDERVKFCVSVIPIRHTYIVLYQESNFEVRQTSVPTVQARYNNYVSYRYIESCIRVFIRYEGMPLQNEYVNM